MKKSKDNKLTSISIDTQLYKEFKKKAVDLDISFKQLVLESLHKFVSGSNLIVSGSV